MIRFDAWRKPQCPRGRVSSWGSPVTGNPHGRCDRERRCAKQIRIAIVAIGDGIAQPMRSPVGD
jgi:hypothetical protein